MLLRKLPYFRGAVRGTGLRVSTSGASVSSGGQQSLAGHLEDMTDSRDAEQSLRTSSRAVQWEHTCINMQ